MLNRMKIAFLPVLFSLMCVCVVAAPTTVMAADNGNTYGTQVAHKFTRGIANTLTGWVEIPKNVVNVSKEQNIAVGLTWGLIKGCLHTVGRTVVGVFDLVTFFVPTDKFVHPNYAWQPFKQDTTYGKQ